MKGVCVCACVCVEATTYKKNSFINQMFESLPAFFSSVINVDFFFFFLRVPIQIHPTFTVRISPVKKSISTAGGEYNICNVTN